MNIWVLSFIRVIVPASLSRKSLAAKPMKNYILLFTSLSLFILTDCNSNSSIEHKLTIDTIIPQKNFEFIPYFDFDNIEHYYINISEDKVYNPDSVQNKTEKQKRRLDILTNSRPLEVLDTLAFSNLERLNFKKNKIEREKFSEIKNIFSNRKHELPEYLACAPIFRDILIFKNQNKIIGVTKICFTCNQKLIIGAPPSSSEAFGQKDYQILKTILHQ